MQRGRHDGWMEDVGMDCCEDVYAVEGDGWMHVRKCKMEMGEETGDRDQKHLRRWR